MLSLDLLKTFVRVAELKSFSAAAAETGVARGVVSKRIAQLEAVVGQPVFNRSTRRVELTPAGELLVDTLRRAIDDIELCFVAVQELRALPSGVVRATAPVSWGQRWLCPRIPRFLERYPHIELELVLTDSLKDLASERYDVGFRMTSAPDQNLVAIALEPLARHLCATATYLRKRGEPKHPTDLAAHETMNYWSQSLREPLRFEKEGEVVTLASRGRFRANSPEAILAAVASGTTLGVLPAYVCEQELASGKLKVVLPDWRVKSRLGERIFAVGTPERMRLARCKALVEFVREQIAPPPVAGETSLGLIKTRRFDEALAACQLLLHKFPDVVDGLERSAQVHAALGDHAAAAGFYRDAFAFVTHPSRRDDYEGAEYYQQQSELQEQLACRAAADPAQTAEMVRAP